MSVLLIIIFITIGSGLTLGLMLALGLGIAVDFGGLFWQFHLISFSNDFWQLDPKTDHLIQIIPVGFQLDTMAAWVIQSLIGTAAVAAVGGASIWLGRRLT